MLQRFAFAKRSIERGVRSFSSVNGKPNIVLIDAARTPFCTAFGPLEPLIAHDLGRIAIKGLVSKTGIDPKDVEYVSMGCVIQECRTSNVGRESAMEAGIPLDTPAHTVTMACISANQAITSCMAGMLAGQFDVAIAGGTDTMSDVPIRLSRILRKKAMASQKIKNFTGYLQLLKGFNMSWLIPEAPGVAEFSTNEIMGASGDRLAQAFGVTRKDSDDFAARSHSCAAQAQADGLFTDIVPVMVPQTKGKATYVDRDNGIRPSPPEKMAKLKPAFIRPYGGTVTAANSSFLTDGGSAALIMTEDRALELGMKPKAYLRDWTYAAQDPKDQMLLGPAYCVPKLFDKTGHTIKDIAVWEFHEAFAGQVLANLRGMDSDWFSKEVQGRSEKLGEIPMDKLNNWGGSLSLGHPFGATGTRLVNTAANRLIHEDGQFAVVAACAAGGVGHACLIERYPGS